MNAKHVFILFSLFSLIGCDGNMFRSDLTPPGMPRGIYTATGDNIVDVFWLANTEPDVAGYNVFVSSTYNGVYQFIGSTSGFHFIDDGARNGQTYYYAVSAYDFSGNESALSHDVVYDTPRPEGYDVLATDYRTRPGTAGYDFSTYSVGPYDDNYTDVFFEYYNGTYYMDVWDDTDIQDMGYTASLYEIGYAPETGWSPTKDVRLIVGHTYVVWTWDNHYAKLRVTALSPSHVVFDWAFQLQQGNLRLKPSSTVERTLHLGEGAKSRKMAKVLEQ